MIVILLVMLQEDDMFVLHGHQSVLLSRLKSWPRPLARLLDEVQG